MSRKKNKRQERPRVEFGKPTGERKQGSGPGIVTLDRYMNQLARLGYGQNNLMEYSEYPLERLTQNYGLMNSLYRNDWIAKKIIDMPSEDMCKNWYTLSSKVSPDALDQYRRAERKAKIKQRLTEALKWGRLYGGAAAIMMIDGHGDILDQPLHLDMVMPDSLKGLIVLDRWSGISPSSGLVDDLDDPDFGLPDYYVIL